MANAKIEVLKARTLKEGAGFVVRRTVGCSEMPQLDPFAMLDHFGPVVYAPGTGLGAPDHPHSGVEILSYCIKGGNLHHDTLGNEIETSRGECMLMHAGDGLEHSELMVEEVHENGGEVEGFQIWFTLPKAMRMGPPEFLKVNTDDQLTKIDKSGKVKVKVLYGKTDIDGQELASKVKLRWPLTYLDIRIRPYGQFSHKVEAAFTTIIYCYRGSLFVSTNDKNERKLQDGEQAQVISSEAVSVRLRTDGNSPCRVLLLSSKPHGEEVFQYGGLLATSQEELQKILYKARTGGFGTIPGAEERRKKTEAILAKKRQMNAGGKK